MSKQLHYIVAAFLLLLVAVTLLFFISKIPSGRSSKDLTEYTRPASYTGTNIPLPDIAIRGKAIFFAKCASCHNIFKEAACPALSGFEERHKWADRNELYRWIRNPSAYMKEDEYTRILKEKYGSVMTAFPDLTNEEIDAIVEYIGSETKSKPIPMPIASR